MTLIAKAEEMLGRSIVSGAIDALTGDLNERLRVREMESVYRTSVAPVVPLPSFFIEALSVAIDGAPLTSSASHVAVNGTFRIVGDEIRLADAGSVLTMDYLARIPPYDEAVANAVYTEYPSLLLYGLLTHHARLSRDADGVAAWETAFEAALASANAGYSRSKQSQFSPRPMPRYRA